MGIYPNYKKLLIESPKKWWAAIMVPYHMAQFQLNNPEKHDTIFNTVYKRYRYSQHHNPRKKYHRFRFIRHLLWLHISKYLLNFKSTAHQDLQKDMQVDRV